jgi:hypothetical protein
MLFRLNAPTTMPINRLRSQAPAEIQPGRGVIFNGCTEGRDASESFYCSEYPPRPVSQKC